MSNIKIITDSACDIPRHYKDELNIAICPLSVTIDGVTYREWYDITPSEFMEKLVSAREFPKTALAGPESFLEEYKNAESEGYDEAIVITIAAESSGTNQSARIAAEMGATKLILMTDIKGLLRDKDDENTLIPLVKLSDVPKLKKDGIISGGMIPKINCCIEAKRGVNE